MSHERLDAQIAAHQAALETQPEVAPLHECILSILQALASHEITKGHALRLLGLQALRATDEPTHAALYRQAAADIRQMQHEEYSPAGRPPLPDETRHPRGTPPEDPTTGGVLPPRTRWYFCSHWQRFLVRGAQHCVLCEPPPQQPPAPSVRRLRAIFPILDASGAPVPASARTDEAREGGSQPAS